MGRTGFLVTLLTALAGLAGCSNPPYPRGDMATLFAGAATPKSVVVASAGRPLHTMQTEDRGAPMLLFVHGSPGDWKAWVPYLKSPRLAAFGPRVSVDRPGFGASGPGQLVTDLRAQANMLAGLIPPGQRAVVVGHSLGGPLAAWMAIDHPDRVCGAVSIAGSLSPDLEMPRWYNHVAQYPPVTWLVRKEMLLSNDEMMVLAPELRKLRAAWGSLRTPLLLIQGGKDMLVDPATVDEVERMAPKPWLTVLRLPAENHFVLWEKPDLVIDAMLKTPCLTKPSGEAR